MSLSLAELAPRVCDIARLAAGDILAVYDGEFSIQHKDDRSPLTAADLAAHRRIVDGLSRLTPDWPILSEESASIGWSERQRWTRYWLVDPLDGTREFVKRNGEFTVNIALIDGGNSVLGVVLAPVTGELAFAWQGGGAWAAQGGGDAMRCRTRERQNPLRVAGSRSHGDARMQGMLDRLGPNELMPLGSSLKFLRIAAAQADLYVRLGPTSEWDTAAAQCVLEQAGGAVLDFKGKPLRYNGKDSLLNPEFIACGDPRHDWAKLLSE